MTGQVTVGWFFLIFDFFLVIAPTDIFISTYTIFSYFPSHTYLSFSHPPPPQLAEIPWNAKYTLLSIWLAYLKTIIIIITVRILLLLILDGGLHLESLLVASLSNLLLQRLRDYNLKYFNRLRLCKLADWLKDSDSLSLYKNNKMSFCL